MAVNLTATARLNTGPFTAGLKTMQAGLNGLSATQAASSAKTQSSLDKEVNSRKAAGAAAVAQGRSIARQEASINRLAVAQDRAAASGNSMVQGLSGQRYLFHDLSRQMAQYTVALAAPFAATLGIAANWENAFSAVERTADPAFSNSTRRVNELRASLVDMVQAMPVSFGEVTEIATLANQMGIASGQVADFTRATAMFSATSGVSVDQAATAFGRLTSIMGDNRIGFNEMADSILKVGVNSVATEGEIINVTTQISSIAAGAKFSTEEMIGLSGALASVRVPPELSRGVITRVFGQIDKAVASGGANLNTLARLSGRTSEQFAKDWRSGGGAQAFTDFLGGLRSAGSAARGEIESLGITSVRDIPVLLRLANAADSDGNAGGLLSQTMRDAQNAAGETQRQYSIMADTVWSKMKVLGSNVLAMFDEIGQSNLGGFGNLLDNMISGVRDFTDSLSEPMKLLGGWEMPWTNAEALGAITNLSLMAAGMTGLGAIATRVGASFVGLKQAGNLLTGGKMGGMLLGTAAGMKAGAGSAAAEIAATTAAATASRPALAAMRSGAVAAGTAWANLGKGAMYTAYAMGNPKLLKGGQVFDGVIQKAPAAQGALGNLVKFGLHPATLAIGAATTAAVLWSNNFFEAGTGVDEFAERLASVDTNRVENIGRVFSNLDTDGASSYWKQLAGFNFTDIFNPEKSVTPFANGLTDVRVGLLQLAQIRKGFEDSPLAWNADFYADMAANNLGLASAKEGIEQTGKALQGLVDAGNKGEAVNVLRAMAQSGTELKEAMEISPEIDRLVKSMFATADIDMTNQALNDLATGGLNNVYDAYLGMEGAIQTAELFEGDIESAGKFAETLDTASAAFIDFGSAMEGATSTDDAGNFLSFDLDGFSAGLAQSVETQAQWQDDMVTIAKETTTGVVEQLANLGPAAAPQVNALAEALRSADPALRASGEKMVEQMEAGVEAGMSGFGGAVGQMMANQDWLQSAVSLDLADFVKNSLSVDQLGAMREAGVNASQEVIQGLVQGLAAGEVSFDQVIEGLETNVPVDTFIRNNEAAQGMRDILSEKYDVEIPVSFSQDSTVAELQSLINDPNLAKIDIPVGMSLEDAYLQIPEFKSWADANKINIPVDADTANAQAKAAALDALIAAPGIKRIDAQTAAAQAQALALDVLANKGANKPVDIVDGPATGKLVGLEAAILAPKSKPVDAATGQALGKVSTLDGLVTAQKTKPVDAATGPATGKVGLLNAIASAPQTKVVNAETATARAQIMSLNGLNTSSTHTIWVNEVGGARVAQGQGGGGGITKADGGTVEFYANGGVRENHTAQIVPAGTMRTWAEPETGGEAYIPLSRTKRKRSAGILAEVASRFGMALMDNNNAARYADGGAYAAQSMSRSVRTTTASAFAGGLSVQDRQFFEHLLRTVVVTADSQAITGLTNNINDKNTRFAR